MLAIEIPKEQLREFCRKCLDGFVTNGLVHDAVLRPLTIIGEAARRLSSASTESLPDVQWRKIIALRNVVVHDYEGVNLPRIWAVVTKNLPELVATLSPLYPDRSQQ